MTEIKHLFRGDKILYRKDGVILEGIVSSMSGDRIYLVSGWVTYKKDVVRAISA